MSRHSRIAALTLGLLLTLVIGGVLAFLGYCKYHMDQPVLLFEDNTRNITFNIVEGAAYFDKFAKPLFGVLALGIGLILLAAFRGPPVDPAARPQEEPIDPLAD